MRETYKVNNELIFGDWSDKRLQALFTEFLDMQKKTGIPFFRFLTILNDEEFWYLHKEIKTLEHEEIEDFSFDAVKFVLLYHEDWGNFTMDEYMDNFKKLIIENILAGFVRDGIVNCSLDDSGDLVFALQDEIKGMEMKDIVKLINS